MKKSKQIIKSARKLKQAVFLLESGEYQKSLEIIKQSTANKYGLYMRGYSYLKMNNAVMALVEWWPVLKQSANLHLEAKKVAKFVFSKEYWKSLGWRSLQEDQLERLVNVARYFNLRTSPVVELQNFVFQSYWRQKKWSEIAEILNIGENLTTEELQLLAKCDFHQARKSKLKPISLAARVLSGGASQLISESAKMNQNDYQKKLQSLSNELYLKYYGANPTGTSSKDAFAFSLLMEIDTMVLSRLLQMSPKSSQSLLLSPGCYYFRTVSRKTRSEFMAWLTTNVSDQGILALYDKGVYSWVRFLSQSQLKQPGSFTGLENLNPHPSLRILFGIKQLLDGTSPLSEDPIKITNSVKSPQTLIDDIAVLITRYNLEFISENKLSECTIQQLDAVIDLVESLRNPNLMQILYFEFERRTLEKLSQGDDVEKILGVMKRFTIDPNKVPRDFGKALERYGRCKDFLQGLIKKKWSRKELRNLLHNDQNFLEHIALLADTAILTPPINYHAKGGRLVFNSSFLDWENTMGERFVKHCHSLMQCWGALKWEELDDFADFVTECNCILCQQGLVDSLPYLARTLKCALPPVDSLDLESQRAFKVNDLNLRRKLKSSVFSNQNPFDRLGISPDSTKSKIVAAVMRKIEVSSEHMASWRQAQAEALDPCTSFLYRFLTMTPKFTETETASDLKVEAITPREFRLRPKEEIC